MYYAQIKNGIVQGVIIADAEFIAGYQHGFDAVVPATPDVGIGWTYSDGVFTAPPPPAPPTPPPVRILTKLQYMNRFHDAELEGVYTAAKTVVQIEIWLDKFKLATDINLDDPETVTGLENMVTAGLLTQSRVAEILA